MADIGGAHAGGLLAPPWLDTAPWSPTAATTARSHEAVSSETVTTRNPWLSVSTQCRSGKVSTRWSTIGRDSTFFAQPFLSARFCDVMDDVVHSWATTLPPVS